MTLYIHIVTFATSCTWMWIFDEVFLIINYSARAFFRGRTPSLSASVIFSRTLPTPKAYCSTQSCPGACTPRTQKFPFRDIYLPKTKSRGGISITKIRWSALASGRFVVFVCALGGNNARTAIQLALFTKIQFIPFRIKNYYSEVIATTGVAINRSGF